MFKKLLTTTVVALTFASALSFTNAMAGDNERPMIQLIKDHEVVETREMTNEEYEAYQALENMEIKFDEIEGPLEALEEELEAKAEKLEMAVEKMIERKFSDIAGDDNDEFEYEKETAVDEITALVEQMKPNLKRIKVMANQMQNVAENFKDEITQNLDENDYDSIRVIDGDDKSTMHFDEFDTDQDFASEFRF
jgi:Skp family chaperone for outer membrane proteins